MDWRLVWRELQQTFRLCPRQFNQIRVVFEIGIAQQRNTGLAATHEFAGTAQMQVLPRDLETVGLFEDDAQALGLALTAGWIDAERLCRHVPAGRIVDCP